jgi:DeoR/GlpR family transcriptional regulator of sugar metabolism
VITNSPPIAVALAEHPARGRGPSSAGMLDKEARALVGAATIESLASVRADLLVSASAASIPRSGSP